MFLLHQPMKSVCLKSPRHKLMSSRCPPYPHAKSFEMSRLERKIIGAFVIVCTVLTPLMIVLV